MIPVLHVGGHTAYAKSCRRYLDQMKTLEYKIGTVAFTKYSSEGYWAVRRTNRFWYGNFTDQTIE